ncbi:KAT8 regulatory NSL complex subunit 2 isoform X2 [Hetaerina americana]|uniref:KAT8 regulatory NSL complex subunit 2 isoform X2 n=1 Tax=Hetaerina americana TaxID=62018 RepID=UPI003A7F4A4E
MPPCMKSRTSLHGLETLKVMYRHPRTPAQKKVKSTDGQTCKYQHYKCNQFSVEGYEFCLKHILEDRTAPFKQCNHVYQANGKRCLSAAPRGDKKDGFCAEHAYKAQVLRQRAVLKRCPPQTPENMVSSLSHYLPRSNLEDSSKENNANSNSQAGYRSVNPFVDIDVTSVNQGGSKVLDFASESDSDAEAARVDDVIPLGRDESESESVDSEAEDPLRHAGVFTAEEVALQLRDKLIRLQSLYIEQYRRLQQVFRESRRVYIHSVRKEKETLMSIHRQPKWDAREQKLYEKLKALNRYHRRNCGVEALLHKKARDRRAQLTDGTTLRLPPTARCVFTEGGVRCPERSLPLAKHCSKHILLDTHQVLFRHCGCTKAGFTCLEPVVNTFEDASCVFHVSLPPLPPRLQKVKVDENSVISNDLESMMVTNEKRLVSLGGAHTKQDASALPNISESVNSETSTDTATSMDEHMQAPEIPEISSEISSTKDG